MRVNKKILLTLFVTVCSVTAIFFNSGLASAAPFARGSWYGYFDGSHYDQWGDNLFPSGIGVTDINSFVGFYWNALNDGNARDQASAAFTIMTMLGEPAGSPMGDAYSRFSTWETTVRWYDANGRIGWADNYGYNFNTYLQTSFNDVAWYSDSNTLPSIVFYSPNGTSYAIKRDCANPVGDMGPLQIIPPTVVSCGMIVAINPSSKIEAGDKVSVITTVTFSGGPPSTSWSNYSMSASGVGPLGIVNIWQGGNTIYIASSQFTVPSTGRYSIAWQIQVNETMSPPCGGTFNVPTDSFDVFNYPYIDVRGGDTAAGSRFATSSGSPCASSNPQAGIVSWNKDGSPSFSGGGGQYAASSFNWIQDFLTNKGNGGAPSFPQYTSLSFAGNNSSSPDRYGGGFGKGPCVDYWGKRPTTGQTLPTPGNQSLNGLSGVYTRTGDVTINPSNLGGGTHLTLYVDGNVSIKGNICYDNCGNANPTWTSMTDIPSFKLVVHGNIFIDSGVDRLDGTFVAIPDAGYETRQNLLNSPVRGTIITCSSGFSVINPAAGAGSVNACRRTLTVNGAFAANMVYFLRTIGSMSNGTPAEQFNFNPEVWLSPDSQGAVDPTYQSIVGLPPVL